MLECPFKVVLNFVLDVVLDAVLYVVLDDGYWFSLVYLSYI